MAPSGDPSGRDGPRPPWSDLSVVDVHGHVGSFKGYDLSVETLLRNIREWGVDQVLVSNIDGAHLPGVTADQDEATANAAALSMVRAHPEHLRAIAWTRPGQGGSAAAVEPFLRDHGFVGLKLHPEMNQFPADGGLADPYLALAARYGVPAVFHSDHPGSNAGPERIYAAARRHPGVPVVLYHMVMGGPHASAVEAVATALKRKDADLYVDTAQVEPEHVLQAIRTLGAGRVLFGTDATYYGKDHYARYAPMIALLRQELSPADLALVTRENAVRLFKLGRH